MLELAHEEVHGAVHGDGAQLGGIPDQPHEQAAKTEINLEPRRASCAAVAILEDLRGGGAMAWRLGKA